MIPSLILASMMKSDFFLLKETFVEIPGWTMTYLTSVLGQNTVPMFVAELIVTGCSLPIES